MGIRPRTDHAMKVKSRRCPKCGGKINSQKTRASGATKPKAGRKKEARRTDERQVVREPLATGYFFRFVGDYLPVAPMAIKCVAVEM